MYGRTTFDRDTTIWKSGIWGCEKKNYIEKFAFKDVQIKSLAMHINNILININKNKFWYIYIIYIYNRKYEMVSSWNIIFI